MRKRAPEPLQSDDYHRGRRDGLRLAQAILAVEEEKWERVLGQSHSWVTNIAREVRHKAFQVAQKRVQRELNRLKPKNEAEVRAELTTALDKLGL